MKLGPNHFKWDFKTTVYLVQIDQLSADLL